MTKQGTSTFDHKYMPWDLNNYYHGNNMHGCPNIVVAIWMNKHNYECLWLSYSPKVICIRKGVAYLCMQPNCTYQCTVTISFSMALILLCYMVVIMGHIDIRAPNIYFLSYDELVEPLVIISIELFIPMILNHINICLWWIMWPVIINTCERRRY